MENPAEIADRYQSKGYCCVPGLFTPDEVRRWKADAKRALAVEGWDDPSGVRVWMENEMPASLDPVMTDERITPILHAILGPEVGFLSCKAVFKDGRKRFGSPWHQDWFYWKGSPKLSIWIALDEARADNGCLRVIPGSHARVMAAASVETGHGFGDQIRREDLDESRAISLECTPGDAVFFHDLLVHGSHENASGEDRWSLISTYRDLREQDDSVVWKTVRRV